MGLCASASKTRDRATTGTESTTKEAEQPDEEPQINLKEEIELKEQLGKGAMCKVHKGWWKTRQIFVAVKTFHCPDLTPTELSDFKRELRLTKKLAHPNVVTMLAGCTISPNLYLIVEFVELGSLGDIIHKQKLSLPWRLKLRILLDTAKGMIYLHQNKIVHRDLKPDNLLVASLDPTAEVVLKIADLGISKLKEDASSMTIGRGTTQWMAPEVLDAAHRNYSFPVDVYSYGIIMWELVAHQLPFIGLSFFRIPVEVARGLRPPLPPDRCIPHGYNAVMTHAWATDPRERPTFDDVFSRLKAVLDDFLLHPRDFDPFNPPPFASSMKALTPDDVIRASSPAHQPQISSPPPAAPTSTPALLVQSPSNGTNQSVTVTQIPILSSGLEHTKSTTVPETADTDITPKTKANTEMNGGSLAPYPNNRPVLSTLPISSIASSASGAAMYSPLRSSAKSENRRASRRMAFERLESSSPDVAHAHSNASNSNENSKTASRNSTTGNATN